jgi:isocitrate dehydrogenase
MTKITVAKGDGIGPEIMDATLDVITAAGADLDIEEIAIGERLIIRW